MKGTLKEAEEIREMFANAKPRNTSNPIRRINLFGGPGCGKSSISSWLFAKLKEDNLDVEFAPEYIKTWTYIQRECKSFDQVYIFAKQLAIEHNILSNSKSLIVSECPILLNCFYGYYNKSPGFKGSISIAQEFEMEFPSTNIFLVRGDNPYNANFRYHAFEEAIKIDKELLKFMTKWFPIIRKNIRLEKNYLAISPILDVISPINEKDYIYKEVKDKLEEYYAIRHQTPKSLT